MGPHDDDVEYNTEGNVYVVGRLNYNKGDEKLASKVASIFFDAIPKYPSGKLLRHVLRKKARVDRAVSDRRRPCELY